MKKLVLASNNENKLVEIKKILQELDIQILSLKDMKIDVDVKEDATTFIGNAYKKAITIFKLINNDDYMVLADDSGLCVDVLGGAPGIYSARFAGENKDYKENNKKLLQKMKNEKNREAKFVCAMVLVIDEKKSIKVQGEIEGSIGYEEQGKCGFGYDPLFYLPKFKKTFAQMRDKDKNLISHRRKALNKMKIEMLKFLQEE